MLGRKISALLWEGKVLVSFGLKWVVRLQWRKKENERSKAWRHGTKPRGISCVLKPSKENMGWNKWGTREIASEISKDKLREKFWSHWIWMWTKYSAFIYNVRYFLVFFHIQIQWLEFLLTWFCLGLLQFFLFLLYFFPLLSFLSNILKEIQTKADFKLS